MSEEERYQTLLEQNRDAIERLSARHDLDGVREIEIGSQYPNWETARAARTYVIEKYGRPQGVPLYVSSRKYNDGTTMIDLKIDLVAKVDAETITKLELMLHDAAEKFGGELPGWEVSPKRG